MYMTKKKNDENFESTVFTAVLSPQIQLGHN